LFLPSLLASLFDRLTSLKVGAKGKVKGFASYPSNVIPTERKLFCHPDRAKRAEGSPKLEDVLPGGFLASFEMTGGPQSCLPAFCPVGAKGGGAEAANGGEAEGVYLNFSFLIFKF